MKGGCHKQAVEIKVRSTAIGEAGRQGNLGARENEGAPSIDNDSPLLP